MITNSKERVIIIGTSAGGVSALNTLFKKLSPSFSIPIIVVLHLGHHPLITQGFYSPKTITLKEADEKEPILRNHIYFAPADYHLLIEDDFTFSLSTEEKIQFARPSIDVTMESLASVYEEKVIGIILTGANEDGARGLEKIKNNNGIAIVQNLNEAQFPTMPQAAFNRASPDYVMTLEEIAEFIIKLEGK